MNTNKTNNDEVIINFNYALGSKTFFFSVTKSGGGNYRNEKKKDRSRTNSFFDRIRG